MNDRNYVLFPSLAAFFLLLAAALEIAIWLRTHQLVNLIIASVFALSGAMWVVVTIKRRRESRLS